MLPNQGQGFRSSSASRMSAFKPFAPDLIPQHQSQHQQQQQQPCTQASVGSTGSLFQPSGVYPSYCGAGNASLPRGQSPDIGYVSLEHPSRSASFVSQVSMQFSPSSGEHPRNNCSAFTDKTPSTESRPLFQDSSSSTDSSYSGYPSSHNSIHSSTNAWMPNKSGVPLDGVSTHPHKKSDNDRRNMYSTVTCGYKGRDLSAEAARQSHQTSVSAPVNRKDGFSGVSDLRNILMIKETELRMMRDTMAKNETAILQVFEDRKRKWQAEMSESKREWENQMQALRNKSWKAEELLQFQASKLAEENKRLQAKVEELSGEKTRLTERCHCLQTELHSLKADMRGLLADVSTKGDDVINQVQSGSIDMDRYKIDSIYGKATHSCPDNIPVNHSSPEISNSKGTGGFQERRKLQDPGSNIPFPKSDLRALSLPDLQRALESTRRELEVCRSEFQRERQTWKVEKEKVVDYQKRLQLSYLQVLHKNRLLELDVQQLTGEMAALDIKQLAKEENQSTRTDQEESIY